MKEAKQFLLFDFLFAESMKKNDYAEQVAAHIRNRYHTDLCVEHLAKQVNIDRRYLSRTFKKTYGMTVQQYIIHIRMQNASRFLRNGYSVMQAATMVGYDDVFHFSKMFKKVFGLSPKQYTKQED